MKRSEARILVYLNSCDNFAKTGNRTSDTLKIDYIYMMKLLRGMYNRGWIKSHRYQERNYFEVTKHAPMEKAKEIITDSQSKIHNTYAGLRT